jgi:CheY-like chemotaxis protein
MGSKAEKTGNQAHILVINDVPALLDLFRELLEEEGYQVSVDGFSAVTLEQQLARVKAIAPDLIVLDFLIGGEDLGWQLLEMIRLDPATVKIPLLVCTAAVQIVEQLQAHLNSMGIQVVLKPFDLDQLLAAITSSLNPA